MSNEPHDLPSMECFKAADALVTFQHGPSIIADRNRIAEIIQYHVFTVPLVRQHPQWPHESVESKVAAARERTARELYEAAIQYGDNPFAASSDGAEDRQRLVAALDAAREAWGWKD